ncbi:MAG: T9SS type A sorting domain-containing protein [Ignavibacteria bacterium]|nr:T9SS type A sorting domain-containing protein [Ignavibacteria bacterium]
MKTVLYYILSFFIILFFGSSRINAQWTQTSGPQGGTLYSIASNGGSTVFASIGYNGVYKSTDNGAHWLQSGLYGNPVGNFYFSSNSIYATDQNSGIYRSKDNGSTWIKLIPDNFIWSMGTKGNNLYASTYDTLPRIITSADNGLTWTSINDPLTLSAFNAFTSNSNYVFAAGYDKVIRSSDNGSHWINIPNGLPSGTSYNCIAAYNSNIFIGAGGSAGIYRSTNNGLNWIFSGLNNLNIASFAFCGNVLLALTTDFDGSKKSGIYRSTDFGLTWILSNNDIVSTNINTIGANNNFVFAGMGEMGLSRSSSKGKDWVWMRNTGFKTITLNNIVNLDNDIYTCNSGAGIYYSANNGTTWTDYNIGLKNLNVNCLAVQKSKYIVYAGTDSGVFKTSPTYSMWTPSNNGLTSLRIMSIAVDGNYLFAGTYFDGIFKSTNGGQSWDTTSFQFGRFNQSAVGMNVIYFVQSSTHSRPWRSLFASYDKGITWTEVFSSFQYALINSVAATGNLVFLGNEDGVYRSTDKGATWKKSNLYMKDSAVTSIYYYNNLVVAGTSSGNIYKSSDNGNTWNSFNTGLTNNVPVNCLGSNGKYVFAGSIHNSIWRNNSITDSPDMVSEENINPEKYTLLQNYPNPFNPVTRIRYSLAFEGNVLVKVYDISGKEITRLVNEKQSAGYHEITFDAAALSSGVYFYEINSGSFKDIKKMILIK